MLLWFREFLRIEFVISSASFSMISVKSLSCLLRWCVVLLEICCVRFRAAGTPSTVIFLAADELLWWNDVHRPPWVLGEWLTDSPDGLSDLAVVGCGSSRRHYCFLSDDKQRRVSCLLICFLQLLHCLPSGVWNDALCSGRQGEKEPSLWDVSVSHYCGRPLVKDLAFLTFTFCPLSDTNLSHEVQGSDKPESWVLVSLSWQTARQAWVNRSRSKLFICTLEIRTLFPYLSKDREVNM